MNQNATEVRKDPAAPARPARLESLVHAQLRAASTQADERGEKLSLLITGESRPVRVDAARVSRAIGGMLQSAVRLSAPGARLRADVGFGFSQAVLSVGIEGEQSLELERSGILHEILAEVRTILEEHGGSLRISARSLTASLPLQRV